MREGAFFHSTRYVSAALVLSLRKADLHTFLPFSISDLSFNNIEVIEGLDTLTQLQDLTLYNNRISRIENMDALHNLQVFSIGNNDLKELENVSQSKV